jgi:hypothetical protein
VRTLRGVELPLAQGLLSRRKKSRKYFEARIVSPFLDSRALQLEPVGQAYTINLNP